MRYRGTINGLLATLEADVEEGAWRGRLEVGGVAYVLEGYLAGQQLQGLVTETTTGQQAPLLAAVCEQAVELLAPVQARLEAEQDAETTPTPESPSPPAAAPPAEGASTAELSVELDARLVGTWLWTDSSAANFPGGASIVMQERLVLNPDGTYLYGDARVMGGGFDTGPDGSTQSGRWRTEDSVLYQSQGSHAPQAAAFVPLARYVTDGRSLLLTFGDGSKRLWQRAGYA